MTPIILVCHLANVIYSQPLDQANVPQRTEMAGYLIVPHERVPDSYNAGFSMYVAAWPLLKSYPGNAFQSGLFGTWMFPQFDGEKPKDHYTDIEGGLGWWRDTRFATETPKFIMGGVTLNFSEWANGPGAGKGRNWNNPTGLYGVAQLSPWVLWPPDGLNLKQGTRGELFGYGYLPLPLTDKKMMTAGKNVPTGNHSWTLFLNTANFKGPVAFFTPYFWSKASTENAALAGLFLDSRPSEPNKAIQMETQHVPAMVSKDQHGNLYARIAPTQFPGTLNDASPLIHQVTAYHKGALWDDVERWFADGPIAGSSVSASAAQTHQFKGGGYATWRIYIPGEDRQIAPQVDWATYAHPVAINPVTYGYRWSKDFLDASLVRNGMVTLPEYYRLSTDAKNQRRWVVVPSKDVPEETGLLAAGFPPPRRPTDPYVTPAEPESAWKTPGPVAGPFKRTLGDNSEVTFYWYRFADQPALLNADLTPDERETLQKRVELLHRHWVKDRNYLPPPTVGSLASIDPALIVSPPKGYEIGYVPIVTRQGWRGSSQD
ncbi:hypothetical protein QPK87_10965 [Kamptonema cortianum]|nr:hypothetical protein [Geitlerinema splendidum]MDK3157095.1 hypothetical protein [Kamptonema cortianum]